MERIVDGGIDARSGCSHSCARSLQPESVIKLEDILLHDDGEGLSYKRDVEVRRKLSLVPVEPFGYRCHSMGSFYVCVH